MMITMLAELSSKAPIDCILNESGVRTVTNSACLINGLPVNYQVQSLQVDHGVLDMRQLPGPFLFIIAPDVFIKNSCEIVG